MLSSFEEHRNSLSTKDGARTAALIWALLSTLYVLLVFQPRRALWFDELITYNVAKAPTLSNMLSLARRFDLNPLPVDYLLTRFSMAIFGESAMAVRAPSIVAFYIASLAIFLYVRRKAGNGFAAFAAIVLWYSPVFYYATEARPYALMCACFASLLLFWDIASTSEHRSWALWGVAISNAGLVVIHAFAPLSLLPFWVAEALRYRERRKTDYALWAALVLPALLIVLYLPAARTYTPLVFPAKFQAGLRKIPIFFLHVFENMSSGMFAAILATILVPVAAGIAREKLAPMRKADLAFFALMIFNPVLLNMVLRPSHGPFWDRYCLTTTMTIYVALAICLARRMPFNRLAGYAAAAVLACVLLVENVAMPRLHATRTTTAAVLTQVQPELPLVAASGLTFFEMDHHEGPDLVSRLYYLRDRAAAVQYAHATLFEDLTPFDLLKQYFPIRGNVDQYSSFTREHHEFLVLGTPDYPEDWLLRKLADDSATLSTIGVYDIPYKDHTVYHVTIPNRTSGQMTLVDRRNRR